jgi:glycosyltransferase involved in cell wall biosynthesis
MEKLRRARGHRHEIKFLVKNSDVLSADWSHIDHDRFNPGPVDKKSYDINWVMSPPGKGSGGHQNLFRFIRYTEQAGHKCRIYLYTTQDKRTLKEITEVLDHSYPQVKASIEWLDPKAGMTEADAIFATGWETAYPVFNSPLQAQRFYFVQDFEPNFYPVGSEYILAENSYRFNFYGTTAGGWLARKLHDEYGMETDYFDFGADSKFYSLTNEKPRKEIFFYARPVTARRGFELGVLALQEFHKKHPDYKINLAGWDVSEYAIPFPYENLMSMPLKELSAVYNRCSAALVISLTNMSLLPLEILACGTIPVVNDAPNNRLVSDNPYLAYAPNNPAALAEALSEIVSREDQVEYAKKAAKSVKSQGWDKSGQKFVEIVERKLRNG